MKKIIILYFLLHLAALGYSTIINIPADYATIQAGIDASVSDDTVLVQPGTYTENINFEGKNITLGSLYFTTHDTSYVAQTIIDGNSSDCVVTFANDEFKATLSGFTIKNGSHDYGGGIHCYQVELVYLQQLVITDNYSEYGGGIYCEASSPVLNDVVIKNNSVNLFGGGVYCLDSNALANVEWNNVTIKQNVADKGGGIWLDGQSNLNIKRGLIVNNSATAIFGFDCGGGGLWSSNSTANLTHCTFYGNNANADGDAIYFKAESITILNTIVWGSIFSPSATDTLYADYCDIEQTDGYTGEDNINADPLFVDPAAGDFHLTEYSPCIDKGDPDSPLDPDLTRADIGRYYFCQNTFANFTADITYGLVPLTVQFSDSSVVDYMIETYMWDFQNDGIYDSFLRNPTFTYNEVGSYDVKLKVSNETQADSVLKQDFITVYCNQPAAPQNVDIEISGEDAFISWSPVDTTIYGNPIEIDYYLVLYSEDSLLDSLFYYLV